MPAEPGLFRLRPDLERAVEERLPPACRSRRSAVRFMLSVEISTIYKKFDRTRKIHHLIYTPGFDAAERVVDSLSRIGNLHSDGRPILGLDSRHLLEIALESDPRFRTSSPPISGRPGSPRWARSPASTPSTSATGT